MAAKRKSDSDWVSWVVIAVLFLATTKPLSGRSYLYPLVPFNWKVLKRLLFRAEK